MDKLKLTYTPEGHSDRGGKVSLTIPHGDVWSRLIDDFVAFLNLTGYGIPSDWVEDYRSHTAIARKAADIIEKIDWNVQPQPLHIRLRDDTGEDEMESSADNGRDNAPARRRKQRPVTKKKKKKKKAKA